MISLNNDMLTQYVHQVHNLHRSGYVYRYEIKNDWVILKIKSHTMGSVEGINITIQLNVYNEWVVSNRNKKINKIIR